MSLKRRPPAGNVRRVAPISNNLRGTLTNKMGRIVQFESFAERSLLLRLERDNTVQDYASQPEAFHAEGQACYVPDFIVWRCSGTTEIHEVTRSERRVRISSQAREHLATAICQARGWRYVVHTEMTLPQGSELSNLLSLVRYRPTAYEEKAVLYAGRTLLHEQDKRRLVELAELLITEWDYPAQTVAASLCHYLWNGQLVTDWQHPILARAAFNPDAWVWLPEAEVKR